MEARHAPPSCQAMNDQVEKDQGTLAEMVREMLKGRSVPEKYWLLALQTSASLKNRTPHEALGGRLPVEAGTGEAPELSRLHTFGCAAYVQMEKGLRDGKGGDVRWKGTFVGYPPDSPAWLVLDPDSERIREAYHVKFVNNEPGMRGNQGSTARESARPTIAQLEPQATKETQCRECAASEDDDAISEEESNAEQDADAEDEDVYDGQRPEGPCQEGTRRSARAAAPRDLWDPSSAITDGTEKLFTERQSSYNQAHLAMATDTPRKTAEPQSWREAVLSEDWLESMRREKDVLKPADANELTEHEPGMRVEHGIWRFRAKLNQNGEVTKLKFRYIDYYG